MREWLLGNPDFYPHPQAVVRASRRHSDDKQAEDRRKSMQIARQRSCFYWLIYMLFLRNLMQIARHSKSKRTAIKHAETIKADALWSIRL